MNLAYTLFLHSVRAPRGLLAYYDVMLEWDLKKKDLRNHGVGVKD